MKSPKILLVLLVTSVSLSCSDNSSSTSATNFAPTQMMSREKPYGAEGRAPEEAIDRILTRVEAIHESILGLNDSLIRNEEVFFSVAQDYELGSYIRSTGDLFLNEIEKYLESFIQQAGPRISSLRSLPLYLYTKPLELDEIRVAALEYSYSANDYVTVLLDSLKDWASSWERGSGDSYDDAIYSAEWFADQRIKYFNEMCAQMGAMDFELPTFQNIKVRIRRLCE